MRNHAAAVLCAAVLLAAAATAAEAPAGDQAPPRALRNEDVVRMLVSGVPPADVIAKIRSADAAFDLSDEMAQELRLAGVPADVLAAMSARQAEVDHARAAAKPPVEAMQRPPEGQSSLVVTVRSGADGRAGKPIVVPARLDDSAAKALQAGASERDREVTDVAVFLACRTPDHVPDQWRSKSPLGRDFVSVPRHQILDFKPGAARAPASTARGGSGSPPARPDGAPRLEPDALVLPLPVELRGAVEPGLAHDLVVGIAIRVGERYLEIAEARKDGVVPAAGGTALEAVVTEHRDKNALGLELKLGPVAEPAPAAP